MNKRRGQGEDRVRCPKCGNLVRRADLEPCSALNHDVPDFRLVKGEGT